jgi:hypothetical protein
MFPAPASVVEPPVPLLKDTALDSILRQRERLREGRASGIQRSDALGEVGARPRGTLSSDLFDHD